MNKATILGGAALLTAACGVFGFALAAWADNAPVVQVKAIRVAAKRFVFTPAAITIHKGETVDIELVTEDVLMGFNVPDLNVRADIVPGQTSHVRLKPDKPGTYTFVCDVFCGSGHENMNGTITVVD